MAKKELSIILRAVNEASGTLNAVKGQLGSMGMAADKADKQSTGLFSRMVSWATSARGIVSGLMVYFSARGIVGGLRETANEIDLIAKQSKRLGLTTEYLSELKYAADLSGIEFSELSEGISNAVKNVNQFARTGGGRAADAIRALGVDVKDANGQIGNTEDLIDKLIQNLSRVGNSAEQVELTKRIFGNDRFLQVIKEGGERMAIMRAEARRLGVSLGPEMAGRVEGLNDSLTRVGAAWKGVKAKVLDQIAPFLTDLFNKFAGVLAAVPKIVGNFVELIRKAFADGEVGESIRIELTLLVQDLMALTRVSMIGIVRVAYVAAKEGLALISRLLQSDIVIMFSRMIASAAFEVVRIIPSVWAMIGEETGSAVFKGMAKTFDVGMAAQQRAVDEFIVNVGKTISTARDLNEALNPEGSMTESWAEIVGASSEVADAAGVALRRIDSLLGVTKALGETDITGLVEQFKKASTAVTGVVVPMTLLDHVIDGMKQHFGELPKEIQRAIDLGRDLSQSLTIGLSQGVGSAMTDVISGTKKFGDAMKEVLANTARNVSTLIFQFLALRAIMGIAGAFSGGGAGLVKGGIGGVDASNSAFANIANRGGRIDSPGRSRMPIGALPGFNMGGLVKGPSANFDSILAALTPGERVIREPVSRQHAKRLDHLNNTGEWVGGGGMNVTSNVTVNVSGGGGGDSNAIARAVERAAADGVLKALQNRPGYRGAVKGALA